MIETEYQVLDALDDTPRSIKIHVSRNTFLLSFPGYGDAVSDDGHGWPVMVEVVDGMPRLLVWSDINAVDPTHVISLAGAAESARKGEEDEEAT